MGILGKLVEKVVDRVTGRGGGHAPRSAPTVAGSVTRTPPPKVATPPVGEPTKAQDPAHERLGGRGGVAVVKGSEGPVADADALANIEAGCQEVKERVEAGEPVLLLDVRTPDETAAGVIPGARLIPLDELEARWTEVKDANELICYCASGKRSLRAAKFLREKGIFNTTSLEGGITTWQQLGGAVRSA